MSNPQAPTISPTSVLFSWDDYPNTLSIHGTTETHAVSAYVNGSTSGVSYNFQDNTWSYQTDIIEYGEQTFTVLSENGFGELSDSALATAEVKGPHIEEEFFDSITTNVSGKVNDITDLVEASKYGSPAFDSTDITLIDNDFILIDLIFTNPEETVLFRAKDSFGNISEEISKTFTYKLDAPVIDSYTNPVTSTHNIISGTSNFETIGFSYSPIGTSGYFSSGAVTGGYAPHIEWSYDFVIMTDSENFNIKAVDIFGQESEKTEVDIDYILPVVVPNLPTESSTNSIENSISGYCSSASEKVFFSTLEDLDKDNKESVKIVSKIKGNYLLNSTNNILKLTIDGVTKDVILTTGVVSAQDIVDDIDTSFGKNVSFEANDKVGLKGNYIKVGSGTGNSSLGFEESEYVISLEFSPNINYPKIFEGRDTLEINIDGIDYSIKFDGTYNSLDEIVNEINYQVVTAIAFEGSLILSSKTNIFIKKEFPDFNIYDKIFVGLASYTQGDTSWTFAHSMVDKTITLYVSTIDLFHNYNTPVEIKLNYEIDYPVILSPGEVKSLTDNIAASGSMSNKFYTLNGDFNIDGILLEDKALSLGGDNVGDIYSISKVEDTYIETQGNPNWEEGDSISVYAKDSRPTYNSNKLSIFGAGTCDDMSYQILYATDYLQDVKVYSQLIGPFSIDSANNILKIVIDGRQEEISLPLGTSVSVLDVVNKINSYFIEYVSFVDGDTFYIKGNKIKILDGNANSLFDLTEGEYSLAINYSFNMPVTFTSADKEIKVDINIDLKDIKFIFELNKAMTNQDIADKFNSLSAKKIAFITPQGISLLGKDNIKIDTSVSKLSMTTLIYDKAIYTSGISQWDASYKVLGNQSNLIIYGQDYLYGYTTPVLLPIIYKIDPPVITTYPLESTQDIYDISGTFDPEGEKVQINGGDAFGTSGDWTYTLVDLINGNNSLRAVTIDAFGSYSLSNGFVFKYNDVIANTPAPEPSTGALTWKSVISPSLSNNTIDTLLETVDSIFKPIQKALKAVSEILDIVKAFIASGFSWMDAIRKSIQAFIDEITELLDQIINGAGIYILNTLPQPSLITEQRPLLSFLQGGFSSFLGKVDTSLSDKNDPFRPQLNDSARVGAYVIAVSDSGGVDNLIQSIKSLVRLINKEVLNVGLSDPINLRSSGENHRVVLTWRADPNRVRPGGYRIYRTEISGGIPVTKRVKTLVPKANGEKYTLELDVDPSTGVAKTNYELVGQMNDYQTVNDFKFVDGISTIDEKKSQNAVEAVANKSIAYMDAFREYVMVSTAESGVSLENGKTYYYQVRSFLLGADVEGKSPELIGTPSRPDLELITENLSPQMINRDKNNNSLNYNLYSAIYDDTLGVYASDPSALTIRVDGGVVQASKIFYTKGNFVLDAENNPRTVITAEYWGKKQVNSTRAYLVGRNQGRGDYGEYIIKKDDPETNTLTIQVGRGSNILKSVGGDSITIDQTVTLVRDFTEGLEKKPVDEKWLTPDEVVSIIRAQTSGMKIRLDRKSKIILEENQNPDVYLGSYLEIKKGNSVLGFNTGDNSAAGPTSGNPPDWYSIRIADLFPIFNDLLSYVQNVMNSFLSSLESATKALIDFIDLLQAKIEALSDLAKKIQKFINDIVENLQIQGGFYTLEIPYASGGNDYFIDSLRDASGAPENSDYAGGVVLLYTDGATGAALDFILAPIKGVEHTLENITQVVDGGAGAVVS